MADVVSRRLNNEGKRANFETKIKLGTESGHLFTSMYYNIIIIDHTFVFNVNCNPWCIIMYTIVRTVDVCSIYLSSHIINQQLTSQWAVRCTCDIELCET